LQVPWWWATKGVGLRKYTIGSLILLFDSLLITKIVFCCLFYYLPLLALGLCA
jgi:hypothetical protein